MALKTWLFLSSIGIFQAVLGPFACANGASAASMHQGVFRDHHVPASFPTSEQIRRVSLRSRQTKTALPMNDFCSTNDPTDEERILMARTHHEWRQRKQDRKLQESETIDIPVSIHILLQEDDPQLVSFRQVNRYIKTLNKGFGDSPFKFTLYSSDTTYNDTYAKCREEASFKQETRASTDQDGADVLHLWLCETNADNPGRLGYSYFPPITRTSYSSYDGVGECQQSGKRM
jgi:hypothetical protein